MDFAENHHHVYTYFAPNVYRTSRVVGRSGVTCPDMGATMFSRRMPGRYNQHGVRKRRGGDVGVYGRHTSKVAPRRAQEFSGVTRAYSHPSESDG